jgi:hypothetical protein
MIKRVKVDSLSIVKRKNRSRASRLLPGGDRSVEQDVDSAVNAHLIFFGSGPLADGSPSSVG